VRDEVKMASGDLVDMKRFEPAMRHLLDMYIRADSSEQLMDFEELGLIELIVEKGIAATTEALPESISKNQEAMAETIENNVRRTIVDENPVNPKYYEQMSVLLDELIKQRRQKAIDYQEYLERIRELSSKVIRPEQANSSYPTSMDTQAKRAFYDNFGKDEVLATKIDSAIRYTKKADWVGDRFKEREIANAVREEIAGYQIDIPNVMELAKAQKDYH
jgi:type I restriction enzyme R subunit